METGQYAEALATLEAALREVNFRYSIPLRLVGHKIYQFNERPQDALRMWAEALDLAEDDVADRANLGVLIDADTKRVTRETPRKIQAAKLGQEPPVAPLGKGVSQPLGGQ